VDAAEYRGVAEAQGIGNGHHAPKASLWPPEHTGRQNLDLTSRNRFRTRDILPSPQLPRLARANRSISQQFAIADHPNHSDSTGLEEATEDPGPRSRCLSCRPMLPTVLSQILLDHPSAIRIPQSSSNAAVRMVQMQMEYYFVRRQPCKTCSSEKYGPQGFVYLSVLQNFNRIKQLPAISILFECMLAFSHNRVPYG